MPTPFELPQISVAVANKWLRVDPTGMFYIWDDGTAPPGGAYATIQDNGTPLPQRSILNFTDFFTVIDNLLGLSTDVAIDLAGLAGSKTFIDNLIANTYFTINLGNDTTFVDTLIANTYFTTNLATDTTFIDNLISNTYFTTNLATDTTFIDNLISNTYFTTNLVGDTNFITEITTSTTFIDDLISNTYFTINLANDSTFITNLTSNSTFITNIVGQITVKENGSTVGTAADTIDFINGTNTTVSVIGSGSSKTVQINATGIGGAGGKSFDISYLVGGLRTYYTDIEAYWKDNVTGTTIFNYDLPGQDLQTYDTTADWASATSIGGAVTLGGFLYVKLSDGTNHRVYRYLSTNVGAGGTLMTISGVPLGAFSGTIMASNGTDFFFTYQGGTSADSNIISKYSLSGTTLTWVSDVTCGATATAFASDNFAVKVNGNIITHDLGTGLMLRFNSAGVLQFSTAVGYNASDSSGFYNWSNSIYTGPFAVSFNGQVFSILNFA